MSSQNQHGHPTTLTVARSESVSAYDVWVRSGLLDDGGALIGDACRAPRYAIITDSQVYGVYGERLQASLSAEGLAAVTFRFAAGEWNKTSETWVELTDGLLRAGFGRDAVVIALGGGVVGDAAGFVAARPRFWRWWTAASAEQWGWTRVWARIWWRRPSSTGLPSTPVTSRSWRGVLTASSPASRRRWGGSSAALGRLIARSTEVKGEVVSRDVREKGCRRVLDFGHRLARAQEAISGYAWLHGEALAVGMAAEGAIGEAVGVTRGGVAGPIREVLEAARLPVAVEADVDAERFLKALQLDRERRGEGR
jgi:3-dehydroquinate synthase